MNIIKLENNSERPWYLPCVKYFILERNIMRIINVEKPSDRFQI